MNLARWILLCRNLLRALPQLISSTMLMAVGGCATTYRALPLSTPMAASTAELTVSTQAVAVSADVQHQEIDEDSQLLVVLDLTANQDLLLDLRDSRLLYGSQREQLPIATGTGEPPSRLAWNEVTFTPALQLRAAEPTRAWVLFAGFEGPVPELPVHLRVRVTPDLELTLSDPGEEPVWQADPVRGSQGQGGLWAQWSQNEATFNVTVVDARYVFGPLVFNYRFGVGFWLEAPGQRLLCCSLPLAADLALPLVHGNVVWSPYLGIETATLPSEPDDPTPRSFWVGPVLGIQIGFGRLRSRHGPFPIAQPASVLTASNLRIGLTNWFGNDRAFPDFGMMLSYSLGVSD